LTSRPTRRLFLLAVIREAKLPPMKTLIIALGAAVCLTASASAGTMAYAGSSKQSKNPIVPTKTCFADQEMSIDTFASYQLGDGDYFEDSFGGGVAINYFWNRYFGITLEGNWNDGSTEGSPLHSVSGLLVLRAPMEGEICFAPYVFAGGGGHFDSKNSASVQVGGGVEVRLTEKMGVFGDGRAVFADSDVPGLFRLGLRWLF